MFPTPFSAAKLITQCAVLTLNWIPLTNFRGIKFRTCYVTNSMWVVHLYSCFFPINKRKDSASRQAGIDCFFSKSQRTEGNGGADKAAFPRRPANVASVPSAVRIQPVTVTPVDKHYAENLGTKIPRLHIFLTSFICITLWVRE